jgi:hypothetical protein
MWGRTLNVQARKKRTSGAAPPDGNGCDENLASSMQMTFYKREDGSAGIGNCLAMLAGACPT